MNNDLLFLSGNDIPFIEAQMVIHQPTIKEIAYIGEQDFFIGCELINFSKNNLTEEDKKGLENKTDFDILIAILRERNAVMQKNRNCVEAVLALIFPDYFISFEKDSIVFKKENDTHYNPAGDMAKRIADKLKKRHQKLAEIKGEKQKIDILNRYISILAVGENKDMNSLFNYTVYQLYDEFDRYKLKLDYDIYFHASLAGAKDLKEVEDWMKDIHS